MSNEQPAQNTLSHQALPESTWFWRRVLMFGFSTLLAASIAWVTILIAKLGLSNHESATEAVKDLTQIILTLTWVNCFLMVMYLVAPSGEQIAKMFAYISALRTGFVPPSVTDDSGPEAPPVQEDAGNTKLGE